MTLGKTKSLILAVSIITSSVFSSYAIADENCGDYLGALRSNNFEKAYRSYMSGISDMGFLDSSEYRARFINSPSDGSKSSGQWMMQRAMNKYNRSSLSTKLSSVIKVTM